MGEQPSSEFLKAKMTPLFWKYALMALAGVLMSCFAVIIDGFFMGNAVGPMALAAISVCLTLMYFAMGTCAMMGVGASTLAGIKMGEGKNENAKDVYATALLFSLAATILISAVALVFLNPLLRFLGATEEILPYARSYAMLFFSLLPLSVLGQISYYFCRLAEKPRPAAVIFVLSGIAAIVGEYIIVFKLELGIIGSAASFIIGVAGTILLIPYLQKKDNPFQLSKKNLKINMGYVVESVKLGFPMFLFNLCPLITTVVINRQIIACGGTELHLSAFGIFNAYIVYVMNSSTTGLTSGLQPIASTNYGAQNFGRLKSLLKVGIFQSFLLLLAAQIMVYLFAAPIVRFFAGDVPELIEITVSAMRMNIFLFAFGNVATLVGGYYIAVGKNLLAILNSTTRVLIFALPMLLIIPRIVGLNGVWIAQPIADGLACIVAVICILHEYRTFGKKDKLPGGRL